MTYTYIPKGVCSSRIDLELEGDTGGSAVIRRHGDRLLLLETPAEELADVDTPDQIPEI